MSIETIRLRLLSILNDESDMIVPYVRTNVLELREQLEEGMSDAELAAAIHSLTNVADAAATYGRDDIADKLEAVGDDLRDLRSGPVKPNEPKEPVFFISFHSGTITGNYIGHTPAEVSDALMAIIAEMQRLDDTPDHTIFNGGVICDKYPV